MELVSYLIIILFLWLVFSFITILSRDHLLFLLHLIRLLLHYLLINGTILNYFIPIRCYLVSIFGFTVEFVLLILPRPKA